MLSQTTIAPNVTFFFTARSVACTEAMIADYSANPETCAHSSEVTCRIHSAARALAHVAPEGRSPQ